MTCMSGKFSFILIFLWDLVINALWIIYYDIYCMARYQSTYLRHINMTSKNCSVTLESNNETTQMTLTLPNLTELQMLITFAQR